nr:MAG: glycosyl transferase [Chloroflexota bacterium]
METARNVTQSTADLSNVSVIIPVYNERGIIGDVLAELQQFEFHEIIVVDDGSNDGTAEEAEAFNVRVIRHPYNIGNGAAVKTGIREATGEIILLMDGDGQHSPADIPLLVSQLANYDMVVGARSAQSSVALHRRLANRLFSAYASYIVDHPVKDLTSGFRAFKADQLRRFLYLFPNGFSYPTTITIAMFRSGYRVRYVSVVSRARLGQSKIRPVRDGLRFLLTITRIAVCFVPMKVFLPLSLLFLSAGIGYGAYLLIFLRRFSNMAALLILMGVLIFLIGLVAEQLALLRLQHSTE